VTSFSNLTTALKGRVVQPFTINRLKNMPVRLCLTEEKVKGKAKGATLNAKCLRQNAQYSIMH
jgi:hypothetical protein